MKLDVIIPVYNAVDTIRDTLDSINKQTIKNDIKIYMVIDCDNNDYVSIIESYNLNIKLLYLDENMGPGHARQFGIDNSNNEYIVFIDADDVFYDEHSLENLYNNISTNNTDLCVSSFIYNRDNESTIKELDSTWLHGKIYRRSFLKDNDIRFNDTRSNEDNGFNRLLLLHKPDISKEDSITYIYKDNANSITRRNNREFEFSGLEGYLYNIEWALNKVIAKKINLDKVANTAFGTLLSVYYSYLDLAKKYDVKKILVWAKGIKKIYNRYGMYLSHMYVENANDYQEAEHPNIDKFISFDEFLDLIEKEKEQ